jgi:anti-sigma B factor antagonist
VSWETCVIAERRDILRGPLQVTAARRGDELVFSLRGELDLAYATTVEGELQEALADGACGCVIVDMTELEFIDSSGIAVLVRALKSDGSDTKLRFLESRFPGVTRVLQLTGVAERLHPPVPGRDRPDRS